MQIILKQIKLIDSTGTTATVDQKVRGSNDNEKVFYPLQLSRIETLSLDAI